MTGVYALASSGGKDSTLALDRAVRAGIQVRYLLNLYDAATGRVAFHGVRRELIERQAHQLGLEPVMRAVESGRFEDEFGRALDELRRRGARGIVFGNIHLADVRGWYEERVREAGLDHIEPLWASDPAAITREVIDRGFRCRVVSVDLGLGRREWLGRELTEELAAEIVASGADPAGERGEFHSFVFDGPLFRAPVAYELGETREYRGHAFVDLVPVATAAADARPRR